jgi:hypothetical protein
MASPPNPAVVPVVTYEYPFFLPSCDRPRPPAQWKARGLLSGSYTLGTVGHWLWPKKSRYDLVLTSGKRLGNQVPVPDMVTPLLSKGEGPKT